MNYQDVHERSLSDPEGFWAEAAAAISWDRPWRRVLDTSETPVGRWFVGGTLNTCYNALDRHLEAGRGEQLALVYDSPLSGVQEAFTYAELTSRVARFAGALADLKVSKGDRVIIYMPVVPEAVIAMLACARLGAIHSVVFGGFSASELALRIDHAKPKVVIAASCGLEPSRVVPYKPMLDDAIEMASHKPEHCVVFGSGARPRLARLGEKIGPPSLRIGGRDGPSLYSLHVGHHGPAQGRGAGQRRSCRGARLDHEAHL
jgi:propionyl-CoA synthetase